MKISITRALNEVKLIEKKIEKKVSNFRPVDDCVGNMDAGGTISIEDFENKAKSDWESINGLIKRRTVIKNAVVMSNSTTIVDVVGDKMTVVEAIDLKKAVEFKKSLLDTMIATYRFAKSKHESYMIDVNNRLDSLLSSHFSSSKDRKLSEDDINMISVPFLKKNESKLVDPLSIASKIEELESYIVEFENNIDFVLSESNAVTMVEIPD